MLRHLLTPGWTSQGTLAQLELSMLLDRGIQALVLDVDRTLLPRRQASLPAAAESWLLEARQRLPIHLLSNNPSRRRIGAVGRAVDLPFTTAAGKPRSAALRRVLAELDKPHHQVALVGDRVFTDVLAGNRLGMFTVLVKPIAADGLPCRHDQLQGFERRMAHWLASTLP
ncbi:MAG: YqeG family HAD IIIA-type phosphatase [Synechococcaceae cyanobacterium]